MQSKEYWIKRAEEQIIDGEYSAEQIALEVQKVYTSAMKSIEKEINAFYGRFASTHELTLTEVNKLLNTSELKAFHEQADLYYQQALENNWRTAYTKEMRTLSAKAYMSRLEELKVNIYHELQKVYETELKELTAGLEKHYSETFSKTMYNYQIGTNLGVTFTTPNTRAIQKIVSTKWRATSFSEAIWANRDSLIQVVSQELEIGITLGQNPKEVAKRIAQKTDPNFTQRTTKDKRILKSNAERLARTEMNRVTNEASFEAIEEFGIFEEYQYLATLDSRTSEICRELDLKKFKLSEKTVGVNFPPLHPNCRSTFLIVTDEIDDDYIDERIARDKNGKSYYVQGDMTYTEWQKRYNS